MKLKMAVDVEQVIRDYLPGVLHMSLATVANDRPWVCEVHFAYDDDLNLYFRSLAARRHSQELAANPNVAGNIVRQYELDEPVVGVYFEGVASQLKSADDQKRAFACLKDRLQLSGTSLEEAKQGDGHQFYKVEVQDWYVFGCFGQPSGQKYQLSWHGGTQ